MKKFILWLLWGLPAWAAGGEAESDRLVIKHADQFEYQDKNGVKVQRLSGHVEMLHRGLVLKSDTAVHYQQRDVIEFIRRVTMDQEKQTLSADKLTYFKRDSSALSEGHVVLLDKAEKVRITGERGSYARDKEESRIWGKPLLTRVDSAGRDTLTVRSVTMTHFGKTGVAVAQDSVVITQGKTLALCRRAEYDKRGESMLLLGDPRAYFEDDQLKGDTMRLFFSEKALQKILVTGHAEGHTTEANLNDPDSTQRTDLSGDTIIAHLFQSKLRKIEVVRHAIGINYIQRDSLRVNRLTGRYINLYFTANTIDSTHVFDNATTVYYYAEKDDRQGRNETSGDTLNLYFEKNRLAKIFAKGGVKGTYFTY